MTLKRGVAGRFGIELVFAGDDRENRDTPVITLTEVCEYRDGKPRLMKNFLTRFDKAMEHVYIGDFDVE